jgi:hypothetical protein
MMTIQSNINGQAHCGVDGAPAHEENIYIGVKNIYIDKPVDLL